MMKTSHRWLSLVALLLCPEGSAQERWVFLGDSITQAGFYVDHVETWFLLNDPTPPEILDLGVSSETVSGLSEPDHPFPRPDLHNRLPRVLDRLAPDVVVACYGMNCAIYHPWSTERFAAYQEGIEELIGQTHATGAEVILLTPPPYAGRIHERPTPGAGEDFGFRRPAADYNDVLAQYADWIMTLGARTGVTVYDIRPGLERFMAASYPREPVHPSSYGHELMAEAFLQGLGKETGSDVLETGVSPRSSDPR